MLRRFLPVLLAALTVVTVLVSGTAPASARARASVRIHVGRVHVADGLAPKFTMTVKHAPKGAKTYLQIWDSRHIWTNVVRVKRTRGSISAPPVPTGTYHYRLRMVRKGRTVAKTGSHREIIVPMMLAHGVTLWRRVFADAQRHPQRVVLMRVNLATAGVRIGAGSPGMLVGAARANVRTVANSLRAVAGVNADFFDMGSPLAVPKGGLVLGGRLVKTPRPGWQANFYLTANGVAHVGPLPYTASLTRPADATRPASTHSFYSVNTLADAAKGRITLVDSTLASISLGTGCTAALLTVPAGATGATGPAVVTAVQTGMRRLARMTAGHEALIACGAAAGWLTGSLLVGDRLTIALTLTGGQPREAVSGGRLLVSGGRSFNDAGGRNESSRNPETFACVSAGGRSVLFGAVDGRNAHAAGMTYAQLTQYLLGLHCYAGLVFDGGGSTGLVAREPGATATSQQNQPSDGHLRAVADGLYVYGRR